MPSSSNIPPACSSEGYEKLGHVAFLDFASMIKAAPALAKYQAWRIGLFDRVELREEREAARGAVVPHAAGRRQSDDDERDLCADPQAGARRRRVVREGRDQPAGRGDGDACSSGWAATMRLGDAVAADRDAGRPRDRGDDRERLARRVRHGRGNGDIVHTYRDLLRGSRSGAADARPSWSARTIRRRCSSCISGSRARGRASRTT